MYNLRSDMQFPVNRKFDEQITDYQYVGLSLDMKKYYIRQAGDSSFDDVFNRPDKDEQLSRHDDMADHIKSVDGDFRGSWLSSHQDDINDFDGFDGGDSGGAGASDDY